MQSETIDRPRGFRSGPERRRSERVKHVSRAWISPTSDPRQERSVEAISLDISRHGIGFVSDQELTPDTCWILELDSGRQAAISEICIASCREMSSGKWHVGAEFT